MNPKKVIGLSMLIGMFFVFYIVIAISLIKLFAEIVLIPGEEFSTKLCFLGVCFFICMFYLIIICLPKIGIKLGSALDKAKEEKTK